MTIFPLENLLSALLARWQNNTQVGLRGSWGKNVQKPQHYTIRVSQRSILISKVFILYKFSVPKNYLLAAFRYDFIFRCHVVETQLCDSVFFQSRCLLRDLRQSVSRKVSPRPALFRHLRMVMASPVDLIFFLRLSRFCYDLLLCMSKTFKHL